MAHIPDGFLSPSVLAGTAVLSVAALAVASRRSSGEMGERQAPVLGAITAFVFAAQMFNFPLGAGTSAHLLGGVLVAVLAGPWPAMLALFSVVLIQALLFADGGISALGANTLNLAVVGAGGGWLLYRWLLALMGDGRRRRLTAAGLAAFGSAMLTGLTVAVQLALSELIPLRTAVLVVGGAHLLVAVAEAGLTVGILSLVLRARPELFGAAVPLGSGSGGRVPMAGTPATARARSRVWAWALTIIGVAAAAAVGAVLLGSQLPDALEAAAARVGLGEGHAWGWAPMADYSLPIHGPYGGLLAALVGVAGVFVAGWVAFRLLAAAAEPRVSGRPPSGSV